ncbi:hypothetical protein [Chitinophaga sancti]|uniref:Lipocalin-like domain-containing protein n=1 Tax=Chitinophaga sancti TaxID=1004 RepID=A0A1K1QT36_9BACT|nr:hypothetical protein [Chitinophaga sancti]WQD61867.1 hypothetical protein U0033_28695 [Chitinophaga sancti]WQG92564.1 hypothetical protein SR876_13690 [Chitinophaga sancti]SFW62779.1 hypothetical protein SAMN05661012_03000 [Chitinophaga sancti]
MKSTHIAILLTLTLTAFTFACKKDNEGKKYEVTTKAEGSLIKSATAKNLAGTWRLTAERVGDGSLGEWKDVSEYKVISFSGTSVFVNTDGSKNTFALQGLAGDTLTSMTYEPVTGSTGATVYLKVYENAIYVSGLNCTEGCTFKYNRAQ